MFELLITGFNTQAEVDAFISWYEGQGEQDATVWFACCQEEGEIDCSSMKTDLSKDCWPPQTKDKTTTIKVKPMK